MRSEITDFWNTPFWANIPDKPSTFPPEAHASSHKPEGSDSIFPADYDIEPVADNAYDFGKLSLKWRNAFILNLYARRFLDYLDEFVSEDDLALTAWVSLAGGTTYVVAFEDETVVYVNGVVQGVINAGERLSLSLNAGDIISANKPIVVQSNSERHAPITWKSTKFVIPFYRNDPQVIYIYAPDADATVDVYVGTSTTPATTVTVAKGTATSVSVDVTPPNTVILESTSPIIVAVASNNGTYDIRFIHPPEKDLIGIPSQYFYVSALEDNTTITWYQGENSGTYTLNRGEIVDRDTLGISYAAQYNITPIRIIADKPIMISSFADGDGFDATCGLPPRVLPTKMVLPVNAQWLSIGVIYPNTRVKIYYKGVLKYETTVSTTYSSLLAPVLLYLNPADIDSSWTEIPYGTVVEADKPVYVVYDCNEEWSDDETVLLGINHRKWRIYKNPTLALATDLIPPKDNTYAFGSESYKWKEGHFAGAVDVGSLKVAGIEVINSSRELVGITFVRMDLYPALDDYFSNGRSDRRWSAVHAVKIYGDIIYEAGQQLKDIYAFKHHTHSRADIRDFWATPFWDSIPDKPSVFPPEAHASSHKPGGADPIFPADYDIEPASDNTYDFGRRSLRWRDIFVGRGLLGYGRRWVISLDGVGAYISVPKSTSLDPSLKDWSVGVWFKTSDSEGVAVSYTHLTLPTN